MVAISPWISNSKREFVLQMLYRGFTPQQVFDNHIQQVYNKALLSPHIFPRRDDYLSLNDIFNISQRVARDKYQLHGNDAESTKQWISNNPEWVFFFQQHDISCGTPFILVYNHLGKERYVKCLVITIYWQWIVHSVLTSIRWPFIL